MGPSIKKLGLLFILLDNLFVPVKLGFDFRAHYIFYLLFILYYIVVCRSVRFRASYFLSIAGFFLILNLIPIINGSGYVGSLRQTGLIIFNLTFAYFLINAYKFEIQRIFADYIQLIYFAAIVGFIQLGSQITGFRYGADYSYLGFDMQNFNMGIWRMQSWFQEPSFLAIAFTPVAFVGISRLFNLTQMISVQKSVIVIVALMLSQSSVGLVGLLLSLIIVITNKYSILKSPLIAMGSFLIFLFVSIAFYSIPLVKLRVDDTFGLFFDANVTAEDIENANLSTYSMYSNFKVTQAAVKDKPILGSGLGSYETNYFKYVKHVLPKNRITEIYALNERDANSMLLRISAELGLLGILLLAWFIYRNRITLSFKRNMQLEIDYWVINNAIFVIFLVRLLRQGHYTMLGFMVFVLIYFYSKEQFKSLQKNVLDSDSLQTST